LQVLADAILNRKALILGLPALDITPGVLIQLLYHCDRCKDRVTY
jgi:hypothetical protein